MERLNIRLTKGEHVKPYECHEIIGKVESCVVAEFSPCGEFLAVGCNNNAEVLIFSFMTHSIILRVKPEKAWGKVLSLKWGYDFIYVLTDANLLFRFQLQCIEETPVQFSFKVGGMDVVDSKVLVYGKSDIVVYSWNDGTQLSLKQDEIASEWFGCFNQEKIIIFGSPNNVFYVLTLDGHLIYTQEVASIFQSAVRDFRSNRCNMILINSKDRALRVFEVKYPYKFELVKEIGDYIERKRWSACCFFKIQNMDTCFVLGTLQETGSHTIKMFDTVDSDTRVSMAKNMHSPLGAAAYLCTSINTHVHPLICVVTQPGAVLLWSSGTFIKTEKWSTSLGIPNFVELQHGNEYYEEPEDQFDKYRSSQAQLNLASQLNIQPFRLDF
ncbi:unnamed protein product [Blepharisma stoltei]|uniref:Uncharacterized protein n=1 Tax=Blepharisma stoltei TaxID=1481888 RepID=A0AAU9JVA6_9CILI|nr:unnamed protein product [Blepharisma stoltei]